MSSNIVKYKGRLSDAIMNSSFRKIYDNFEVSTVVEYPKTSDGKEITVGSRIPGSYDKTKIRLIRRRIKPGPVPPGTEALQYEEVMSVVRGSAADWLEQPLSKLSWPPNIRNTNYLYSQDGTWSAASWGNAGNSDFATYDDRSLLEKQDGLLMNGMLNVAYNDKEWVLDARGELVQGHITVDDVNSLNNQHPFEHVFQDTHGRTYDACGTFIVDAGGNQLYYDAWSFYVSKGRFTIDQGEHGVYVKQYYPTHHYPRYTSEREPPPYAIPFRVDVSAMVNAIEQNQPQDWTQELLEATHDV